MLDRRTPLARVTPLRRGEPLATVIVINGGGKVLPFPPRAQISPVSKRRARENRQRTAMADERWPDRREGTVMCTVPGCGPADDLHEVLTRARGGSITDPENTVPLCRQHNHDLAQKPESELGWAYDCGLLRHSWNDDDDGGSAA
jgi:hypothetical protein